MADVRLYTRGDLRRCLLIAALVGTALVGINQGPLALVRGPSSADMALRMALNYCVPFTVATLSALLADRARATSQAA